MTLSPSAMTSVLGFPLSDEQWAVVAAPLEPAVVVAGAGSGKTTAMAARVCWLIGSDLVASEAVLGLTFTNKAAASLLQSTRTTLRTMRSAGLAPQPDDDTASGEPEVLTYNSFAARILRDHGIRLGREPGAVVLTDGARQQLAYRVVCRSSLPLHELGFAPAKVTSSLLELDDQLSELDIDPQQLIDHESTLIEWLSGLPTLQRTGESLRDTARARRLLTRLAVEWRAEKAARDVIDFTDQTRLALEIARRTPEVVAALRAQHQAVLLDEYQDTSLAQRALLQTLFGDGHPVTAVGDPCQAIYGWRGASVDNIEQFTRHFPVVIGEVRARAPRYTLTSNRRSGPRILEVANHLSASLRDRHTGVGALVCETRDKGPGDVQVGLFETADQEQAWIVEGIVAARHSHGEIAVLASTGKELARIDTMLRERGVVTQLHGAAGLLQQSVVMEVRSILEVLHDPIANPAMLRLLSGPRWRLGARDLAGLGQHAAALVGGGRRIAPDGVDDALEQAVAGADPVDTVSLSEAVLDPDPQMVISPQARERLAALGAELRQLRRHVGEPLTELISRIARVTGLDVEMAICADREQQAQAWSTFLDLAATFSDLDGSTSLGAFLSRLRDVERFDGELGVDMPRRNDAVQLMTIHKAKGLEFGHVFVVSMAAEAFPGGRVRGEWPKNASAVPWQLRDDRDPLLESFPAGDGTPTLKQANAYGEVLADLRSADADRLAYVALTRAMRSLTVTGHWWGPTQTKPRGPEPYLTSIREVVDGLDGSVVVWHPAPEEGATNPSVTNRAGSVDWPPPMVNAQRLAEQAALVDAHRDSAPVLPGLVVAARDLRSEELALIATWDADAAFLLAEAHQRRSPQIPVPLPDSLSASMAIRAMRDPDALAMDLARPMPAAPSDAARRGTALHAWIETRYGQQSLLDPDDLPGAGDDEIASDAQLARLREAFDRTEYAGRQPVAVEAPFSLVIGGRVIRGRIDAVFAHGDRFEVVDWKTGHAGDPLQLAIYRIAWSQLRGVPIESVDAAFVLLATGEVVRPVDLADIDDIAAAVSA